MRVWDPYARTLDQSCVLPEPTGEWNEVGQLPGAPAALEAVGDELLAATHESQVLSSRDCGKTWRDLLKG